MSVGLITLLMISLMIVAVMMGIRIGFALGGLAVIFMLFLWGPKSLGNIVNVNFSMMNAFILVCVPLFIFMALVLEKSGLADDIYTTIYRWMGPLNGGLAMGTVVICTVFAAMSGVVAAGTLTMGLVSLPQMLKRGYSKAIAIGCIMGGGGLGVLIPPSVVMVFYALITGESVGQLFMGGVFPGLLLSALYITYIGVRCALHPSLGPALPRLERATWGEKFLSLKAVVLPIILIIVVLGSIFFGIATPTESSAAGSVGAIICAAIYRRLSWQVFKEATFRTFTLMGIFSWVIIGASCFSMTYTGLGAIKFINETVKLFPVNPWLIVIGIQIVWMILGCVLDDFAIIMITAPIFVPLVESLGFNALWFGIIMVVNLQMAYITPPYGLNLFYMRAVAPESVTMEDIYSSVLPLVVLQIVGLVLCMIFPQIVLWLPGQMIKAAG